MKGLHAHPDVVKTFMQRFKLSFRFSESNCTGWKLKISTVNGKKYCFLLPDQGTFGEREM